MLGAVNANWLLLPDLSMGSTFLQLLLFCTTHILRHKIIPGQEIHLYVTGIGSSLLFVNRQYLPGRPQTMGQAPTYST